MSDVSTASSFQVIHTATGEHLNTFQSLGSARGAITQIVTGGTAYGWQHRGKPQSDFHIEEVQTETRVTARLTHPAMRPERIKDPLRGVTPEAPQF